LQQGAAQSAHTGAALKPIRKRTIIRAKHFEGLTSIVAFYQPRIMLMRYCKLYASTVKGNLLQLIEEVSVFSVENAGGLRLAALKERHATA
jgi:hypothetical protein